jgi:cell division protein FtsL
MRRLPPNQTNNLVHRERDRTALSRLAMLLICGLGLAGGFVFAAQQHFAAVTFGYESEKLRQEHQLLVEEQRRLMLEKEQASTPSRLESAARKLGLQPLKPAQIEIRNTRVATGASASKTARTKRTPTTRKKRI